MKHPAYRARIRRITFQRHRDRYFRQLLLRWGGLYTLAYLPFFFHGPATTSVGAHAALYAAGWVCCIGLSRYCAEQRARRDQDDAE
jgi:hypothetical protein